MGCAGLLTESKGEGKNQSIECSRLTIEASWVPALGSKLTRHSPYKDCHGMYLIFAIRSYSIMAILTIFNVTCILQIKEVAWPRLETPFSFFEAVENILAGSLVWCVNALSLLVQIDESGRQRATIGRDVSLTFRFG